MKKLLLPQLAVLGIFAAAAPMFAHHAFAAEYDSNKPITLKGKLTKVEWVNPHGWIHLDVTDDSGKVTSWAIEIRQPECSSATGPAEDRFPRWDRDYRRRFSRQERYADRKRNEREVARRTKSLHGVVAGNGAPNNQRKRS